MHKETQLLIKLLKIFGILVGLVVLAIAVLYFLIFKPEFDFTGIYNPYGKFVDIAKPIHDKNTGWFHAKTLDKGNVLAIGRLCNKRDDRGECIDNTFVSEVYNTKENKFYKNAEIPISFTSFNVIDFDDEKLLIFACISTAKKFKRLKDIYIFNYKKKTLNKIGETKNITSFIKGLVLKNGELFFSGYDKQNRKNIVEIYQFNRNKLIPINTYKEIDSEKSITLLNSGKVLIIGNQNDIFLFDSITTEFEKLTIPSDCYVCGRSTVVLKDGRVLILGGQFDASKKASIFNPKTKSFYPTGSLNVSRKNEDTILLENGKVLVLGGMTNNTFLGQPSYGFHIIDDVEMFDPKTNKFYRSGHINLKARIGLSLLKDGRVFIMYREPYIFEPNY